MTITIVTGAGSGMGRSIALSRIALGEAVLLVGRREAPLLETVRMSANPALAAIATGDLGTVAGTQQVLDAIGSQPVRAIVAAAGGQGDFKAPGDGLAAIDDAWSDALRKNFFSAVLLIEGAADRLADNGRIVLIGSTAGLDGFGGPYASAKAAMHGYGRDLARRLAARGITVNTLAPGFVQDTEFFAVGGYGDVAPLVDYVAPQIPLGRVGKTAEITSCVDWLLSEGAGWTTGQTISVNGGSVMVR